MDSPEWISRLCASSFFGPCRIHAFEPRNECAYFCRDAPFAPPLCAHCVPLVNPGLRLMQMRRYMYRTVINRDDIAEHVDVSDVQTYSVNRSEVVFVLPKAGVCADKAGCRTCLTAVRPGAVYCSFACKALSCSDDPVSYRTRPRKQSCPKRSVFS
jgi:PLATZ transcription factor